MKTSISILSLTALSALFCTMGCITADAQEGTTDDATASEEGPIGTASSAIIDGQPAQVWMQQRAVAVSTGGCSGTIISNKHVITAAHCKPVAGSTTVRFYNNSTVPSGPSVGVASVALRPGVNPFDDDLTDINGDFADIAILTLTSNIPATSAKSPLAIFYPGSDGVGVQVGRGAHDGNPNPSAELRFAINGLYSDDNSSGYFYTNDDRVNPGDSGGPIYTNGELQGDLWGEWLVAFAMRNKYTAVSYHLPWILSTIGFTGTFSQTFSNLVIGGNTLQNIGTSDLATCRLACMQNTACFGYAFQPYPISLCSLRRDHQGKDITLSGAVSGLR